MSAPTSEPRTTAGALWRRNGLIWAALLALLLLSFVLAHVPMGFLTPTAGIVIAVIKAALVVVFFMELTESTALVRLAALAGVVFLGVLLALTLADVLSRFVGK